MYTIVYYSTELYIEFRKAQCQGINVLKQDQVKWNKMKSSRSKNISKWDQFQIYINESR